MSRVKPPKVTWWGRGTGATGHFLTLWAAVCRDRLSEQRAQGSAKLLPPPHLDFLVSQGRMKK